MKITFVYVTIASLNGRRVGSWTRNAPLDDPGGDVYYIEVDDRVVRAIAGPSGSLQMLDVPGEAGGADATVEVGKPLPPGAFLALGLQPLKA